VLPPTINKPHGSVCQKTEPMTSISTTRQWTLETYRSRDGNRKCFDKEDKEDKVHRSSALSRHLSKLR
jgi:hypothetical protein